MSIDILDLKLPTYPLWVQYAMFGTALAWLGLYAILVFAAPKAPPKALDWTEFSLVKLNPPNGAMAFVATFINNTEETVQLQKAELQYFKDTVPTTGLQSGNEIDTIYVISGSLDDLQSTSSAGVTKEVKASQPYSNQPFIEAVVELSNVLEKEKDTRIYIKLEDASIIPQEANKLQVKMYYSNDATETKVVDLPAR